MNEVTRLLNAIDRGDRRAAGELLPLVYDELKALAGKMMRNERPGQTLCATALVHEAYLRLVGACDDPRWNGRGHFYGAAAKAMRRILVENARRKQTVKHGGGLDRRYFDQMSIASPESPYDLLALDEALDRLGELDPKAAEIVNLRFFAGLTLKEAAAALGVSSRTADSLWAYARAWLYTELDANDL
jgi:RNA polymerase sigma factor (TIGR02999 family)